ncbi:MAG TPA: hypothetical protein ENG16_04790 [Archaeoglobus sp.]|nr:hypothetical protein [Archaeoglobus sp.]
MRRKARHPYPIPKPCPICSARMRYRGLKQTGAPWKLSGGIYEEWECPKCGHREWKWIVHY